MKNLYLMTFLIAFSLSALQAQERYLEPIFDDYEVETLVYATNISVFSGAPEPIDLEMDIYTPAGDTTTNRPVFLYFHTGNFLPHPLNGSVAGTRNDSTVVEIASRLTQLGYVVAVVQYRKGWNPIGNLDDRIGTLLNAAYRGIQDARTAVRFLRKDVVDNGNQFGIDPDKMAYIGQGTGGYISFGAATLDQYEDILIPKFFGPDLTGDGNPDPYVIPQFHGDPFGTSDAQASMANHVTYDDGNPIPSDVKLTINMGGAIGDTSWISENNPPMISFHVPTDPFAPYLEDVLIVPTTGDLIVEVQGSYLVQQKANELGLNDIFIDAELNDVFSQAANELNDGLEGLYPLIRPIWTNPLNQEPAPENAPWEWWDEAFWSQQEHPNCPDGLPIEQCNFHVISWLNNQDMSAEKAQTYIDTIIGYIVPRAFLAFDLDETTQVNELSPTDVGFNLFPNPSAGTVYLTSSDQAPMTGIEVFDLSGRLIYQNAGIGSHQYQINRGQLNTGMMFARIYFEEGVLMHRFAVQK